MRKTSSNETTITFSPSLTIDTSGNFKSYGGSISVNSSPWTYNGGYTYSTLSVHTLFGSVQRKANQHIGVGVNGGVTKQKEGWSPSVGFSIDINS